jgi:trehalose-phosphatase
MRHFSELVGDLRGAGLFLFLDYDGTLVDIAPRPQDAKMSGEKRALLRALARRHRVAVLSGRSLSEIVRLVGVRGIYYAGNHGLEIRGPGVRFTHPGVLRFREVMGEIAESARRELGGIAGAIVENKGFSVGLHYRLVAPAQRSAFRHRALRVLERFRGIRIARGKCVIEARPAIDWDKGKAVLWLLRARGAGRFPVYFGDDETDEDAFRVLRDVGAGVLVAPRPRRSLARYYVRDTREVEKVLADLL